MTARTEPAWETRRPSPPTDRVVRILDALAAHGAMTAADLGRRVDIAPATCAAILASLTEAGYLIREAGSRAYRLGPALVRLGASAAQNFPVAQVRADLEALHQQVGLPCMVAAATDDAIVVLDQVGGGRSVRSGQQVPLAPPFGAIHLAWDGPARQQDWLRRGSSALTEHTRAGLREVLAEIRTVGYAIAPLDESAGRLRDVLSEIADDTLSDTLRAQTNELLAALHGHDYLQRDLAGRTSLAVNTISAPVFGAGGRPVFVVTLQVNRTDLPTGQVRQLGKELLAATAQMTARIGGHHP